MFEELDVIVVGGGHAGCEAAAAAANLGSKTLLITMNMMNLAQMSCNPAMGGIAKGQIVREIDALGGYSGIVSDRSMIQFRMLNRSKGPAMWSPRSQNDRTLFTIEWRKILEEISNLYFWQDDVIGLLISNNKVTGVRTKLGVDIKSKTVILTAGTFLNGVIHIGDTQFKGGRISENYSTGITEQLIELGFESSRMKTGTPARVDGRSLDYSKMEEQPGDEIPGKFSFTNTPKLIKQRSCYLVYTNERVHDILKTGFHKSPMFQGRIQGIGPRYCPSIEDKINRFSDRIRHQLFVEPDGWQTNEIYLNGFSSSLPMEVQYAALKEIEGFENVKIFRPGYAIEYDFFQPIQLQPTLETKLIENLYFAGQINGTTGYEEAACQGLMAGINSHLKISNKDPLLLKRSEAYIGVLIDDLITKGTNEPYRMFTSRAEYRILLRQDNADLRLIPKGFEVGLISSERHEKLQNKKVQVDLTINFFKKKAVKPEDINETLASLSSEKIRQKTLLFNLITRPQVKINDLRNSVNFSEVISDQFDVEETESILEEAEILMKYESYILKEQVIVDKLSSLENIVLKKDFDYASIHSLSLEAREKLIKFKPATLGMASRISGITPADMSVLMIYLCK